MAKARPKKAKPAPKKIVASKPAPKKKQSAAPKKATSAAKPATACAGAAGNDPKERALLEAIWANPRDKDTLGVYADFMATRGDSRGEYIQLELLEEPTDEQMKRARKLEKDHRAAWLGEARPFIRSWDIDRHLPGFVGQAWCEADKLIAGFEDFRWLGPRMVLVVAGMRKQRRATEAKLATLPLGTFYDLCLGSNALDDTSISTLAPALVGSRALHISENEITGVGIAALGAHVTTLEFLQVGAAIKFSGAERDALVDGITEAIIATPGFRSLRYLHYFRGGAPTPARAKQLRAALPNLKRVSISSYTEWRGRDPKSWEPGLDDI